jgi:hypothetical protein
MRLILRTMALHARLLGETSTNKNPEDYQVIVDGPSIGRIYRNPGSTMKEAQWRWTLQVPPHGHGYTETLDQAKAETARRYVPEK